MYQNDNSIQVDFMTKMCGQFLQGNIARSIDAGPERGTPFSAVYQRVREAERIKMGGVRIMDVPTKEMTLEQYKQYIRNKISQMPLDPSQRLSSISVHITDEGFRAMQQDPEYQKWVLDTLRANFQFHDPFATMCGGSFSVHFFGATKEEYRGEGWYRGYQNGRAESLFDEKAKDGFWERRMRHKKYMDELYERWLERKKHRAEASDCRGRNLASRAPSAGDKYVVPDESASRSAHADEYAGLNTVEFNVRSGICADAQISHCETAAEAAEWRNNGDQSGKQ